MKKIYEEFGSVIIVVVAIVALLGLLIFSTGSGGPINNAFHSIVDFFRPGSGDSDPVPTITMDALDPVTYEQRITVTGTATDESGIESVVVTVDGRSYEAIIDSDGDWRAEVDLVDGSNLIVATATNTAGKTASVTGMITSNFGDLDMTMNGLPNVTGSNKITVSGTATAVSGISSVVVSVNGTDFNATVNDDGTWSVEVDLDVGNNDIVATASSVSGVRVVKNDSIIYDNVGPNLTVNEIPGSTTDATVTVSGKATDDSGVRSVKVDGENVTVNDDGTWSVVVDLAMGDNDITVVATDKANNKTEKTISITRTSEEVTYDIVYKSSSGADLGGTTVTFDFGTTNKITAPAKAGYKTPAAQDVVWDSVDAKTITFTYELINYNVTVNLAGGTGVASRTYNVETADFTLGTPSKNGYTFKGWTGDNGDTAQTTVTIKKGTTGHKSYTANWTANSYTITYVLNGGTGDEKGTYTADSDDIILPTPTREGYTFGGWYDNEELKGEAVTKIAKGSTGHKKFYAKWTSDSYTITYVLNGGTGVENSSYNVESDDITLPTPTKKGYTFAGWYDNEELKGEAVTKIAKGSTGNKTFYAKWTADSYSITYVLNGGTGAENGTYTIESDDITLPKPTKTGYTFGGWYDNEDFDGEAVTKIAKGSTGNKKFYAKWTADSYTITYELNGGTGVENGTYTVESDDITLPIPSKTGYTFGGWYDNEELKGDAVTKIAKGSTGNKKFYAKWTVNGVTYNVVYKSSSGADLGGTTVTFDYGTTNKVTAPAKAGYETPAAQNVEWNSVEAKTITFTYELITYNVKFNSDGGSGVSNTTYTIESDEIVLGTPAKAGYTFGGWYDNEELKGDAVTKIAKGSTGDKTFYAKWTTDSYTITYVLNGGSGAENGTYTIESDDITLPTPKKTGFTFGGWYDNEDFDGEAVTKIAKGSTGNKKFYAKWTVNGVTYNVIYKSSSGADLGGTTVTFDYGTTNKITAPAKAGYETPAAQNVEWNSVEAKTITFTYELITYNVKFNSDGGSGVSNTTYTIESDEIVLGTPAKAGYTFAGWYDNEELKGDAVTKIAKGSTGDKTFYAKWTTDSYTITYVLNGGTGAENGTYTVESNDITLPIPSKTGYTFGGWYDNEELKGDAVTKIAKGSTGNKKFYAKWTADSYTITYVLNGGTGVSNGSYNVESDDITLPKPTREGYTFGGWYDNEDLKGDAVTKIAKGSTGNKKFYAKWTANDGIAYTIKHWYQKLGADDAQNAQNYSLDLTVSLTGTTGETVDAELKPVAGFKSPDAVKVVITGDGKAEVNYYYTRNSYTFTLGTAANVGVDGSTVSGTYQYGATITLKATAAAGYTFSKWTSSDSALVEDQAEATASFTMPAGDVTMTPSVTINTYDITYVLNGGTGAENGTYTVESNDITLPTPTKTGSTFQGWYDNEDFDGDAVTKIAKGSTGNKTFYAKWSENVAQAIYSEDDDSLTFVREPLFAAGDTFVDKDGNEKVVTEVFTGFEDSHYYGEEDDTYAPWYSYCDVITTVVFEDEIKPISTAHWFSEFINCETFDMSELNTEQVVDMSHMFHLCSNVTHLDVSSFETSLVENLTFMFGGCSNVESLDVSGWDTSNVTSMICVFADCSKVSSLDVSGWDTSNVTDMNSIFAGCSNVESLDVSSWDTSNVSNMGEMFEDSGITSLDLSNWDTSSVTIMTDMFLGCTSLTSLDLSGWDTSNVQHMGGMFAGTVRLQEVKLGADWEWGGSSTYLPAPDGAYIDGADGYWYRTSDWKKFAPNEIPSNEAATYVAVNRAPEVTYNVVYKSSSGATLGTDTVTYKYGTTNKITAPAKAGYETPAAQNVEWDSVEAKTITFTYELITYNVTVDLDGGTGVSDFTYTVESDAITLGTPSRTGYEFQGWTGSNGNTAQKTVTIAKGSTGDKSYTANWEDKVAPELTVDYKLPEIQETNLVPGLYDDNYTLISPWETLIDDGVIINDGGNISTPFDWDEEVNLSDDKLSGILILPSDGSVTGFCENAFYFCEQLNRVVIPDSVSSIGDFAFAECYGLTSVVIPDSVTSIGQAAFSYTNLKSIFIPYSVTSIEDFAFSTKATSTIYVDPANTKYHSDGNCLIETESKTLLQGYNSSVIPSDGSVTNINDYAFAFTRNLTSIIIPDSVLTIGRDAFLDCLELKSVVIGSGLTCIGREAFFRCSNLTSVTFGNTSGWFVADSSSATSGTSVDVTNPSTAATLLKSTHVQKYWKTYAAVPASQNVNSVSNSVTYGTDTVSGYSDVRSSGSASLIGSVTDSDKLVVFGTVADAGSGVDTVVVTVGGTDYEAEIDAEGNWSVEVELAYGENEVHVVATDKAGNSTDADVTVTRAEINDDGDGGVSGVIPPADGPEDIPEIPAEKLPEIIDFTAGKFEVSTDYTPGQSQIVEYEVTKTRLKMPVSYQSYVWSCWSRTYDAEGNLVEIEPGNMTLVKIREQYSTYIVYDFETNEAISSNGVDGDSVQIWTIFDPDDDTLENAVYLAAYRNKVAGKSSCYIAKWNGGYYEAYDADAQIAAVTEFTETYTVTETKTVQISAPSTTTEYVYIPGSTMQAEKGMTWAEWLVSKYNTTGLTDPVIRDVNYNEISYDTEIVAGESYSIAEVQTNSKVTDLTNTTWALNDILYPLSSGGLSSVNYSITGTAIREANGTSVNVSCLNQFTEYPSWVNPKGYSISIGNFDITSGEIMDNVDESEMYWQRGVFLTITITGGDDVTNAELIDWLYANASIVVGD